MKTAVIFLAVLVGLALAGRPTFTLCSGSDASLQDAAITSSDDFTSDSLVHFTIKGKLAKDIASGATTSTLAYFGGFEVDNSSQELCSYEGSPFKCPEAAGDHTWVFPFQIPSVPFAGTLTAHTDFKNADGSSILCFDMSVDL